MQLRRSLLISLSLALAAAMTYGVYSFSYRTTLDTLERTANVRLVQASGRLLSQLESFRELITVLVRHPDIVEPVNRSDYGGQLNEFLLRTALSAGAGAIYVADGSGVVVASSNFEEEVNYLARSVATRPDMVRARQGSLGLYHAVDEIDQTRAFFFAHRIHADETKPSAYLMVNARLDLWEYEWGIDEDVIVFEDEGGIIFASNRGDLILRQFGSSPPHPTRYSGTTLRESFDISEREVGVHTLWQVADTPSIPDNAMIVTRHIPAIDMTARVFMDTAGAEATARLQAGLAGSFLTLLGLIFWVVAQRRAQLAERLRLEAAQNTRLEARVEQRTAELKHTQETLIQASKLTALGQMSAGISHELSQPLTAIENYATNGVKLIKRDRVSEAQDNLGLIAQQIKRMDRIIKNLRAFSRNEVEPLDKVDVTKALNAAVSISQNSLRENGITVSLDLPDAPIFVRAGAVRLQQVLVNLISNAMDAMARSDEKQITITLQETGDAVVLSLADTGAGLAEPKRVFEPFYTTKEIGTSNGLGLGLSISYGIIQSFGGTLEARNLPHAGAEFTLRLQRMIDLQEAAE